MVQALFVGKSSNEVQLCQGVQQLWQIDILPYQSLGAIFPSKLDQEAVGCLDQHIVRVTVDVHHSATPLQYINNTPPLKALLNAVIPSLCSIERLLAYNPEHAAIYQAEITKLINAGYVK